MTARLGLNLRKCEARRLEPAGFVLAKEDGFGRHDTGKMRYFSEAPERVVTNSAFRALIRFKTFMMMHAPANALPHCDSGATTASGALILHKLQFYVVLLTEVHPTHTENCSSNAVYMHSICSDLLFKFIILPASFTVAYCCSSCCGSFACCWVCVIWPGSRLRRVADDCWLPAYNNNTRACRPLRRRGSA